MYIIVDYLLMARNGCQLWLDVVVMVVWYMRSIVLCRYHQIVVRACSRTRQLHTRVVHAFDCVVFPRHVVHVLKLNTRRSYHCLVVRLPCIIIVRDSRSGMMALKSSEISFPCP